MKRSRLYLRIASVASFVLLTLPCLTLLAVNVKALRGILLFVDMRLRALPLYLSWVVDRTFYDAGELSPEFVPLWVALTGIMLWPLLVLGLKPSLWRPLRWVITGHCTVMFAGTIAAIYWMSTHTGVFF